MPLNDANSTIPPSHIGLIVGYIVVFLSTIYRLCHRWNRHQLWWDDFWASVAFFCAILLCCLLVMGDTNPHTNIRYSSFLAWIIFPLNSTTIWSSRLSIGTTVVRILPRSRYRTISIVVNWLFCVMWLATVIQKIFVCGIPPPAVPKHCKFARTTAILGFTLNFLGSMWLVGWPAFIFVSPKNKRMHVEKIKLLPAHHRLLVACFSTSMVLLVADVYHGFYFFYPGSGRMGGITGHLECMISLFICNVLVLVAAVYRLLNKPKPHTPRRRRLHPNQKPISIPGGDVEKDRSSIKFACQDTDCAILGPKINKDEQQIDTSQVEGVSLSIKQAAL
ncbi:hypothetical protein CPB83DRAFT_756796 [Crepidotus variabilis]|uniref:Uncharacterized protein n=1 Tax=Crepidotus variabilis TaxID=179855 RepID=A0A9P6ERY2_9AGAR|nr:hypothetical protein CPB83DRAFT_756796 [Crepidotus variabilis]